MFYYFSSCVGVIDIEFSFVAGFILEIVKIVEVHDVESVLVDDFNLDWSFLMIFKD